MTAPIPVVRDVFDALGRMIVSTPIFIDPSQLSTYELYGWRSQYGAPVAPLEPGQIPEITMSPTDIRPWKLDWSAWLNGATISTSRWLPGSAELTLFNQAATASETTTWISVAAGVTALSCLVTNQITSSDGREDDQSVTVIVAQR